MRWQVHGTDIATGQQVMLALDETDATHAVQSALSRRILVTHVTREWVRRALFPLACAAVVVLLPLCAALYWRFERLHLAVGKEAARAEHFATLASDQQATIEQLKRQASLSVNHTLIAQAQADVARLEKDLHTARGQIAADITTAHELAVAEQTVSELQAKTGQLQDQLRDQSQQTIAEHSAAEQFAAKVSSLEQSNQQLASQVDLLKSQLLIAAAKAEAPATQPLPDPDKSDAAVIPRTTRWALRAGYDAAEKFVAMHFEKENMQTQPLSDGTVAWSALSAANADTVRVIHDKEKRRVYAATLTVSLTPDAPRQKFDENLRLIDEFVHALAPSMPRIDDRVMRTLRSLADKDSDDRRVLLGGDAKITAWNNGNGVYSWRIESIGNELQQ